MTLPNGDNKIRNINEIDDAKVFDSTSRARTIGINQIGVLENINGYFCAIKIIEIKDDTRGSDEDEVIFEFKINKNKSSSFTLKNEYLSRFRLPDLSDAKYHMYCPRCKYTGLSFFENQCPNLDCLFVSDD